MSLRDHKGRVDAFKEFFKMNAEDIAQKKAKAATVLYGKSGGKSLWERQSMRQRWGSVIRFGTKGA